MSDLLPATDGLFLGSNERRWNLLLKKILSGEQPTTFTSGRLWYFDADGHPYLDREDLGAALQIPLAGDPPTSHGNESHNFGFFSVFQLATGTFARFIATDLTISSGSPSTIRQFSSEEGYWAFPMGGFNYRPGPSSTQDIILDVWWECPAGTQRSAKVPITVKLNEIKHPFLICVPFRDQFDEEFWTTPAASTQTIYLKGQTRAESAIVSDRYVSALKVK